MPFGEFIPYGFRWFTELMNIPLGDFARGAVVAILLLAPAVMAAAAAAMLAPDASPAGMKSPR